MTEEKSIPQLFVAILLQGSVAVILFVAVFYSMPYESAIYIILFVLWVLFFIHMEVSHD